MIFEQKTVLVTGGTGSLGKVLVKRLLSGRHGTPKKVIVFSRDEAKQHDLRMHYLHKKVATDEVIYGNSSRLLEFQIGDVRSYEDVARAIRSSVDIVINTAALKQVPTCEYFPEQALRTNCIGAHNIVRALSEQKHNVETVVGISTDKACKPVNVMGLSKALQERIFIVANVTLPKTRFVCVRYGNVLASRGSVVPLFHNQITQGSPVTITDPQMTRFLLSIEQAVDTVVAAIESAKPGETYIPKAPAATVENIARALIGKKNIPIRYIGVRPGEKTHEILVSEEEKLHTVQRGDYFVILSMLPELRGESLPSNLVFDKEFSSQDNVLSLSETEALLRQHGLLITDEKDRQSLEHALEGA
jgi:FlaA1/EpsC-like NDP-sugar epimerase